MENNNKLSTKIAKYKKKENLIYILIMLVVIFISFSQIFKPNETMQNTNNEALYTKAEEVKSYSENYDESYVMQITKSTEDRIENILSKISGISDVSVMLTYSTLDEKVPINNTKENVTETVIVKEEKSESVAYKTTILPKVQGVIIVAHGIENTTIKTEIAEAVSSITNVEINNIKVFNKG